MSTGLDKNKKNTSKKLDKNNIDYNCFFENTNELLCVLAPDTSFQYLNQNWEDVLGFSEEDLITKPITDFIHPHDKLFVEEELEKLNKGAKSTNFDSRYICADGSFRTLSWKAINNNGQHYSIIKDLTENKKQQEDLNQCRDVINNSAEAIICIDSQYCITSWNMAAEKILGYSFKEVKRQDIREIILPKDFPQSDVILTRVLKDKISVKNYETQRITKENETADVSLSAYPLLNSLGNAVGATVILNDLRAFNAAKNSAMSSAQLADIGLMTAEIGHEIKSPLTVISTRAQLLLKKFAKEDVDMHYCVDSLHRILNSIETITKITDGMRKISRNGEQDPFEPCLLKDILSNTLSLCSAKIRDNLIDLEVGDYPSNYSFECREVQISQVLLNLINNSIDAISDLEEKWIKIDFSFQTNSFQIIVTDSGNGIDQEIIERLMEAFFTTKNVGKGTGLGLSLSKKIIDQHQGEFYYDVSNRNTSFVIHLKRNLAATNEGNKKVLVVDDDPFILEILSSHLHGSYEVLTATSAEKALDLIVHNTISYLILDYKMPDTNGKDLADKIRRDLDVSPYIILHSGVPRKKAHELSEEIGAHANLTKPCEKEELIKLLNSFES